jgi:hypothetical protein
MSVYFQFQLTPELCQTKAVAVGEQSQRWLAH